MLILYIETNFLMAMAKGQDGAEDLLPNLPASVRLVIPSICFLEAIQTYITDKDKRLKFQAEMDKQINESKRDQTSGYAKSLIGHLGKARIDNERLINDIQNQLFDTIDQLINKAELINLNSNPIRYISATAIFQVEALLIKNDIMDNSILQCIIEHSNLYPQAEKVFLSGNKNDFGKQEVREALSNAGIQYFITTKNFLGWFNSRSSS